MAKKKGIWYDNNLDGAIADCVKRKSLKYDNLLIVTGKVGTGKSTLAIQICHRYAELTGLKFDHKNIVFSGDEFFRRGQSANQVILYDEAIEGLMSSNWANKMSKYTVQLLNMNRKFQNFYVLCIPSITKLNYDIVQRAHIIFRTYNKGYSRGYCAIYPDKGDFASNYYYNRKQRRPHIMRGRRQLKFGDHSDKIIDVKAYERAKTKAIKTLMDKDTVDTASSWQKKFWNLINGFEIKPKDLNERMDMPLRTARDQVRLARLHLEMANGGKLSQDKITVGD